MVSQVDMRIYSHLQSWIVDERRISFLYSSGSEGDGHGYDTILSLGVQRALTSEAKKTEERRVSLSVAHFNYFQLCRS